MNIHDTELPGVFVVEPKVYGDARGFFMETWNMRRFSSFGINLQFVQDGHSRSCRGTMRGLHYQKPHPQGKLVRAVVGEVFDVVVDVRRSSRTFGKWIGIQLSAENKRMLWVPEGFAHGFYVTSDFAELLYKFTDYYFPEHECCIRWDDPNLAIHWPVTSTNGLLLSDKDSNGKALTEAELFS